MTDILYLTIPHKPDRVFFIWMKFSTRDSSVSLFFGISCEAIICRATLGAPTNNV